MKQLTKKQKQLNKKLRHIQTKTYADKQLKIEQRKKLEAWSTQIRLKGICAICEAVISLDAHHLLPKETYPEYKFELMNGICLCKKHHKFGKFSAHKNGMWFAEWLRLNR